MKATFASLIAAAVAVSTLMVPPVQAEPAPTHSISIPQAAPGWSFGEGISFGTKNFSGVVRDSKGTKYTCAADGGVYSLASSLVSKGSMKAPKQVNSLKVVGNVPAGATPKKGTVKDKKKLGQMAYIASLAGKPSDVDAAATEAAIARVGGVYSGSIWEKAAQGKLKTGKALKPAAVRSGELYAQAKKYAGPYKATLKIDLPENSSEGTIRGIGLTSASGKNVPGHPFELKLSGPATFVDGTTSIKDKTASSTQKIDIRTTGDGKVTAKLVIKGVADSRPWISKGTSDRGRAQNLIVLGKKTEISAQAKAQSTSPMFEPQIATEVKDKQVGKGDPLVDVLNVTSKSGTWPFVKKTGEPITIRAKVDVYGPFSSPRAKVKDGAEFAQSLIGTYSVEVNGEGSYETDGAITAPEEGFYFFQARVDPKDQGKISEKITAFTSPFFEASETSVVQWQPSIVSEATAKALDDGGVGIRDVITVSGMPEDHGDFGGVSDWEADHQVIVHSLYFVPAGTEHTEGVTEDLEAIATVETPAANGEYVIEADQFPMDLDLGVGTYQVVSEFAGDARVVSLKTSDIEPSEQAKPEFGTVRTKAQVVGADTLTPEGTIRDTVILEGAFPKGAYTDVDLYTWEAGGEPVCEEAIWTAERIEHGNEAGEYHTGEYTVSQSENAVYGFVERTYDQNGNLISAGECGAESETIEVAPVVPPPTPAPTTPAVTAPAPTVPESTTPVDLTPSPSSSAPAELPNTGFDAKSLIPISLALICIGSIAFLVVRRR